VVEAVTGITWLEVTVRGTANHAGTTPISHRKDAGLAAAKMINYLREIAETIGEPQRATCGMVKFEPEAINVIPGKAVLTVDLRNADAKALREAEDMFTFFAQELEKTDSVCIEIRDLEHVLPVEFNARLVDLIESVSRELGLPYQRMVSGAGHDAQLMAGFCPTAMIFVPSQGGVSHNPAEYTSPEDLESGANLLLQTALKLANSDEKL
jgi:N-carbamoyl-L-amino-acid hydrolase